MRHIILSVILLFTLFGHTSAEIKDIVVFEFGEFLRFAVELSEKTDISFSADRKKIEILFQKNVGYGRRKAKGYSLKWNHRELSIELAREFSYARYFVIPFPYKLIVDVSFSRKDLDDIITSEERNDLGRIERKKKVVVIDAGHGGKDPGTVWGKIREKDITERAAKMLADAFRRQNEEFEVLLTRDKDVFIELEERSAIANASECDVFVSLHVNSTRKRRSPSGFEIFYFSQRFSKYALKVAQKENGIKFDQNLKIVFDMYSDVKEEESRKLAKCISRRLSKIKRVITTEGAPLYVLAGVFCPAVLIEIGFIDNQSDREDMMRDNFLRKLSEEIFKGVKEFLERMIFGKNF